MPFKDPPSTSSRMLLAKSDKGTVRCVMFKAEVPLSYTTNANLDCEKPRFLNRVSEQTWTLNSGLDLFGGGGNNASNSTAPKSNFDLLGGLEMAGGQGGGGGVMSSLPPLVSSSGGLNQSGPTNVMMMQQQPTKPQTNSSALLFDSATLSLQPTLQVCGY